MSKTKYKTIMVDEETHARLKKAAELMTKESYFKRKTTISGLLRDISEAYESQYTKEVAHSFNNNNEDWISTGVPIILISYARKHFEELQYLIGHDNAVRKVTDYIAKEAVTERIHRMSSK